MHAQVIAAMVHRALARAELEAPAASQGAFIAVRESSSAVAAVARVMTAAKRCVLIVDSHADAKILTDFAVLAPEGVVVSILSDAGTRKPSLKPAAQAWINQYHGVRPLDVRVTRNLHDRLIVVDDAKLWTLTQSLNNFAVRSSASIVKANSETASLKIGAYREIWRGAAPLMDLASHDHASDNYIVLDSNSFHRINSSN